MERHEVLEFIKGIATLAHVPEAQLAWMVQNSNCNSFQAGEFLFKPGQDIDNMHIIVAGEFRIYFMQQNNQKEIGRLRKGDIGGLLPLSRLKAGIGYGEALQESHVMSLPREFLKEMVSLHYELTEALVHVMTSRVRHFTKQQQQDAKLMSLGKMSAGLTHELNNPASAIVRSATALKKHLQVLPDNFKAVIKIRASEEDIDRANALMFSKIENFGQEELSLSEKTECEDEIAEWLEEKGMEDGYEIAENLVDFGFTIEDLELYDSIFSEADLLPVLKWVENNMTTEKMVTEIEEASSRISGIIKSVKSYTHMDKAQDFQEVRVHEGIKSTITMLKHKFKKKQVSIVKELADHELVFRGMPGRINQIWTNIIDNAIDAMSETKDAKLIIQTSESKDAVRINFIDNGTGIHKDVIDNVFDPFFTTKKIGDGTGLGLDVVNQIINEHHGDIKVESVPGKTVFKLCFPKSF